MGRNHRKEGVEGANRTQLHQTVLRGGKEKKEKEGTRFPRSTVADKHIARLGRSKTCRLLSIVDAGRGSIIVGRTGRSTRPCWNGRKSSAFAHSLTTKYGVGTGGKKKTSRSVCAAPPKSTELCGPPNNTLGRGKEGGPGHSEKRKKKWGVKWKRG